MNLIVSHPIRVYEKFVMASRDSCRNVIIYNIVPPENQKKSRFVEGKHKVKTTVEKMKMICMVMMISIKQTHRGKRAHTLYVDQQAAKTPKTFEDRGSKSVPK